MAVSQAALEFGDALRRAREHRGISLDEVAEATKISASIIGGLERGDLSRWPTGIFRRAFVRAYAEAVGLPVDRLVAAFNDVHGGGASDEPRAHASAASDAPSRQASECLRLHLAGQPTRTPRDAARRAAGVAIDLALPAGVGAVAYGLGVPVLASMGLAAMVSLATSSALAKGTWGQELMRLWRRTRPEPVALDETPTTMAPATAAREHVNTEPRRPVEPARIGPRGRRSGRDRRITPRPNRHA